MNVKSALGWCTKCTPRISRVRALPACFFKSLFNIIFPSTCRCGKWSSTLDMSSQITTVRCRFAVRMLCRVCAMYKAHCVVRCVSRGEASKHAPRLVGDISHLSGKFSVGLCGASHCSHAISREVSLIDNTIISSRVCWRFYVYITENCRPISGRC